MLSSLRLNQETKTNYHRSYTNENGFEADIIMNTRDAMVFAQIKHLPATPMDAVIALNDFLAILDKKYGGKTIVTLPASLLKKLPENELKSTKGVGRYLSNNDMSEALQVVRTKKHVAEQLNKFSSNEYKLLTKEALKTRLAELSQFKIEQSSFVNEEKINYGQYSEKAEEEKINNPFLEQFAIEHEGKIIASVMQVRHADKAYYSDFIINKQYRSKDINPNQLAEVDRNYSHGLAQALCIKVNDYTLEHYPHVNGSWLIAGGYGGKNVGAYLSDEIFKSKTIQNNPVLQNEIGFFLRFNDPGVELLNAANRNLATFLVKNEEQFVGRALEVLKNAKPENLAAQQPQPPKEAVAPISIYTNPDKSPAQVMPLNQPTLGVKNT